MLESVFSSTLGTILAGSLAAFVAGWAVYLRKRYKVDHPAPAADTPDGCYPNPGSAPWLLGRLRTLCETSPKEAREEIGKLALDLEPAGRADLWLEALRLNFQQRPGYQRLAPWGSCSAEQEEVQVPQQTAEPPVNQAGMCPWCAARQAPPQLEPNDEGLGDRATAGARLGAQVKRAELVWGSNTLSLNAEEFNELVWLWGAYQTLIKGPKTEIRWQPKPPSPRQPATAYVIQEVDSIQDLDDFKEEVMDEAKDEAKDIAKTAKDDAAEEVEAALKTVDDRIAALVETFETSLDSVKDLKQDARDSLDELKGTLEEARELQKGLQELFKADPALKEEVKSCSAEQKPDEPKAPQVAQPLGTPITPEEEAKMTKLGATAEPETVPEDKMTLMTPLVELADEQIKTLDTHSKLDAIWLTACKEWDAQVFSEENKVDLNNKPIKVDMVKMFMAWETRRTAILTQEESEKYFYPNELNVCQAIRDLEDTLNKLSRGTKIEPALEGKPKDRVTPAYMAYLDQRKAEKAAVELAS